MNARLERTGLLQARRLDRGRLRRRGPQLHQERQERCDPELRQTKKDDQRRFGMKVHAAFTPASAHDIFKLHGLVRDNNTVVFADSGYGSCAKPTLLRPSR